MAIQSRFHMIYVYICRYVELSRETIQKYICQDVKKRLRIRCKKDRARRRRNTEPRLKLPSPYIVSKFSPSIQTYRDLCDLYLM